MEYRESGRAKGVAKPKQQEMTSSSRYGEYEEGDMVECKFEITKEGKTIYVWWEGLVM
jgi:hypothetical protein